MSETVKKAIQSPKTTAAAVAMLFVAVGAGLTAWANGADIPWGELAATVTAAVGFFLARDADAS